MLRRAVCKRMRQNDPAAPHFSRLALYIFDFLRRRGGSMRIASVTWPME